jgi:hypothetical protein
MSQSKSSYGARAPKGSENKHCQPKKNAAERKSGDGSQTAAEPEPACQCRYVDEWEWVEIPYTAALAASYNACKWDECFIDGPPDVDSVETVIRSRRYPTVFHSVGHPTRDRENVESVWNHPFESADLDESKTESESVESITELCVGDGVAWDCLETPLVVIERNEANGVVLKGPFGGEYQLRARLSSCRVAVASKVSSELPTTTTDQNQRRSKQWSLLDASTAVSGGRARIRGARAVCDRHTNRYILGGSSERQSQD